MRRVAAFFQVVRDTWHRYSPVARDDRDAWRSEFQPPASELRLNRMTEVFRVDRRELEKDFPRVLRNAEIACMRCRPKRRCTRELEAGSAAKNAEHFCPNADLFMILADERNDSLYRGR